MAKNGPAAQAARVAAARLRLCITMAGLALLAACAPRVAAPPPAPPPPPPPPEAPPPPVVKPDDAYHRVAILVPLTGSNAAVGISLANAANLALADTGSTAIRLTSYDTAAGGAAAAANRALADGAALILGPLLANDVSAVRASAEARAVPMISFSNDAALASGGVFVFGFQPDQSVARIVEHARARGARRFAALVPQGVYGQRASLAFTRAVEAGGGQIVALTTFTRDRAQLPQAARRVTDYDARLQRAGKGAGGATQLPPVAFEALLIADSGTIAAAFTPALARFGAPAGTYLLMGTELWATEPGLTRVAAMHGSQFAAVSDDRFRQLAGRYSQRFGGTPSRLASLAYDATLLVVASADRWEVGKPFPQALLADPKGFVGIDGIFRFRGNIAERGLEVREVRGQGFVVASPAPRAF